MRSGLHRSTALLCLLGLAAGCATFDVAGGGIRSPTPVGTTPTPSPSPSGGPTPTPTGIFLRVGQHTGAAGTGNTVQASFPALVSSGGLVVAAVGAAQGASLLGVADDLGDPFNQVDMLSSPGGKELWVFYFRSTPGGARTVSAQFVPPTTSEITIAEFGGTNTVNPFVKRTHTNASSANPGSGTVAPRGPGELDFGVALADTPPSTVSPVMPYLLLDTTAGLADEYMVDGGTAPVSAGFDYSAASGWACSLTLFQ